MERGINKADTEIESVLIPMSDGGEGTVQSLVDAVGGKIVECVVNDPLTRKISAFYGILNDGNTAIIEMAQASGLPLLSENERNPMFTTAYGRGQLIRISFMSEKQQLFIVNLKKEQLLMLVWILKTENLKRMY